MNDAEAYDEQYDEAVTAVFRRLFKELIAEGCDEEFAECEAKERAEAEVARQVRNGAEEYAEDRYYVNRLFAAA